MVPVSGKQSDRSLGLKDKLLISCLVIKTLLSHRLFDLSHPRKKESSGVKETIGKEFNWLPGLGSPSLDCFF